MNSDVIKDRWGWRDWNPAPLSGGDHSLMKHVLLQVLQEIGDLGHTPEQLNWDRKPCFSPDEEEGNEEGDEGNVTNLLKKKKRILTSFQNSFFSGCTPIKE